tara:strand:+ start:377 stop:1237 length:861 start_codon:yes stop_codon:yes gene_type:complete
MNPTPKTLQVFLPEGTPAGIQIAELTTRIVQAISVPRTHLKQFFARPEAQHVGTYFLFGGDDDSSKPLAYIGQTEDLKQRLRMHDAKKEFWTRAVILVSRTHSFTQAHIKWLEWHAIAMATEAKRFKLENGNLASEPHVTEAIQADLHEIFETGALLLQSLGYPIFQPLIMGTGPKPQSDHWFLKRRGAEATASFTNEGIVVHKGSTCSKDFTPGAKDAHFAKRREQMLKDGIIEETVKGLVFTEDFAFKSPSGAAAVISGGHVNGWTTWKDETGKTLKEVKQEKS